MSRDDGRRKPSGPEQIREYRRLLWGLRPTLRHLFDAYGVPPEESAALLSEAIQAMTLECDRIRDPRRHLLLHLERSCERWRREHERETEGGGDGGPSDG